MPHTCGFSALIVQELHDLQLTDDLDHSVFVFLLNIHFLDGNIPLQFLGLRLDHLSIASGTDHRLELVVSLHWNGPARVKAQGLKFGFYLLRRGRLRLGGIFLLVGIVGFEPKAHLVNLLRSFHGLKLAYN